MKTVDFLDAVKAAYGLTSDYQLAKKLAVSTSRITNYRTNRSTMDDSLALQIADLLDVEPLLVMASVHAEREEKNGSEDVANFWRGVAAKLPELPGFFATSAA